MYFHVFMDFWGGDNRLWLRIAVWLQPKVRDRGLGLRPRLFAGSVCDDAAEATSYAAIVALYKLT